ncbi:MAG TPA: lytic transglycosylase domain-containing protein [Acidimicrobiales bacterium]|nr:lytic transglycosylase domain-containing protein [Acidimicrobiales bacterium]
MTHRAVAAALVSVVLVLGGCSPAARRATPTTTTGPTTPSVAPTSTTTTAAPTTTTVPATLAGRLSQAEAALRDPAASPEALLAAARQQQAGYRAIGLRPELKAETVAAVAAAAPALRDAVDANATAAVELRALTVARTSLPPWRIVPPPPAEELLADYRAAQREIGVPWTYLAAIHFVETKFGRVRGTSTAGAQGPMQFLPDTWKQYGNGGDIQNVHDAVFAAARLLKRNGAPARMDDALFSYNRSSHYVVAIKRYAAVLQADERAFQGYYRWQVYLRMTTGDRVLPDGWPDVPDQPL